VAGTLAGVSETADSPPVLHELESEVMEAAWRLGPSTVRELMAAVQKASGRDRAYTTILTVAGRLAAKGALERERNGRADVYRPVLPREEYLAALAGAGAASLVDEYGELALVQFARHMARLDPERREALRRLAAEG
jgi:predicted transcriptional regulator